jgi:hypothetical protein
VEVVADGLCDPTEWGALVADRVQPGAGRGRFGGQPVQACGDPVIGPCSCPLAWLERVLESSRLRRMMVRPRGIMHPIRAS